MPAQQRARGAGLTLLALIAVAKFYRTMYTKETEAIAFFRSLTGHQGLRGMVQAGLLCLNRYDPLNTLLGLNIKTEIRRRSRG